MPARLWIPLAALLVAVGYLPTLAAPFDFVDDGNLVYPAVAGTTLTGHVELWWAKVRANVEHLGPFRPVLWVHWEVAANLFDGHPLPWRAWRLAWCGLAAGMLLWLLRELNLPPLAAVLATAAALWNPYRGEIWTSLTLGEGVAMPYAVFALVAARKAAHSPKPLAWELASAFGVLMALGCKNTFVALLPAQVLLRALPDGVPVREAVRRNGLRALALTLTLALPAAHFVYFKLNWKPGQYEPGGPTVAQLLRILSGLKGAAGLDFLGAGLVLTLLCFGVGESLRTAVRKLCETYRAALLSGLLLLSAGAVVYLPMTMISGRYTLPAAWGIDILFGVLLAAFLTLPTSIPKRLAWVGLAAGLVALTVANLGKQEKFAARARLLWDAVQYVESHAPPGAGVAWVSGDGPDDLNVEEGIHFRWHLLHRGRPDVWVGLMKADGTPIQRVELPPPAGEPTYRMAGGSVAADRTFAAAYRLGAKRFECHLSRESSEVAATPP